MSSLANDSFARRKAIEVPASNGLNLRRSALTRSRAHAKFPRRRNHHPALRADLSRRERDARALRAEGSEAAPLPPGEVGAWRRVRALLTLCSARKHTRHTFETVTGD